MYFTIFSFTAANWQSSQSKSRKRHYYLQSDRANMNQMAGKTSCTFLRKWPILHLTYQ